MKLKPVVHFRNLYEFIRQSFLLGFSFLDKLRLLYLFLRWRILENFDKIAFYKLLRVPKFLRMRFNGKLIKLFIPEDITFIAALHEIFVRKDYALPADFKPRTILDIGANFGLASLYFTSIYPDALIYAFEPASANYKYLLSNISPFGNIKSFNCAISSKQGEIKLFVDGKHGGWNSLIGSSDKFEVVKTLSLDDFVKEHAITSIDLIKIDVEGAEMDILSNFKGLSKTLCIIGELHYDLIDKSEMLRLLNAHFNLEMLDIHPLCPVFIGFNKNIK